MEASGDKNPVGAAIGRPPEAAHFSGASLVNCPLSTVNSPPRLILCSAHPSPLSAYRGFFGSRPYSKINAFLRENGRPEIVWSKP